jgi:hypothetical protein
MNTEGVKIQFKQELTLLQLSSDFFGSVDVPSPHGLRYCLLVIDHHTHIIWVHLLKSKDETYVHLDAILLEFKDIHATHIAPSFIFWPTKKFDSDSVFEAADTQRICAQLSVGTQISIPYAHHMLGKPECTWRTLRDFASAIVHPMSGPTPMWSCAMRTVMFFLNRTVSRAVGHGGGVPMSYAPHRRHSRHIGFHSL